MSRKPHCKHRAAWRLSRAKPAERLSAYYRFDCEYGTSLMTCLLGGGVNPLYLCEEHTKAFNPKSAELVVSDKNRVA